MEAEQPVPAAVMAVGVVDEVAASEHTLDRGARGAALDHHVTLGHLAGDRVAQRIQ
jgi:hypothetical protein